LRLRLLLTTAALSATALLAQQDPPSRVARLSWINGQVSFQPASLDTWTAATLNYPLTTGDHIYTDTGSRAEMHIGPNAIRLNGQTNFGFLNLDDRTVQMRFTAGAMEVRLRALGDQDVYEVDTPNGAISLLRGGDYRIDTDPDRNATMITVIAGEVEFTANVLPCIRARRRSLRTAPRRMYATPIRRTISTPSRPIATTARSVCRLPSTFRRPWSDMKI
jgi:hypothetical protein